jgi:hypothetical protein
VTKKQAHIERAFANDTLAELIHTLVGPAAFDDAVHPRSERKSPADSGYRYGYWEVAGAKQKAIVRASSAAEAIERAERSGLIDHWEFATARYLGSELE